MSQENKKQPYKPPSVKRKKQEDASILWHFESMDRVNRAMQGTNDLEQMMKDVLDALLSVFACDRAWLVYPCDPDSPTWQVPMERTRSEYPGVLPIGVELPLDPIGAEVYRLLRSTDGPVKFGPGEDYAVPMEMAAAFSVQSFIAMAFYPRVGKPWSFGLHQCSHSRVWTSEEERLFQEIGRRLSDTLTSLLAFRNLRESEEQIKQLINASPVAMVVSTGVEQRVEWVNEKFIELFGYTSEDMPDVEHWWPLAYPDEAYRAEIKAQWEAKVEQAIRDMDEISPMEATVRCKDGSHRHVEFRLSSIGEKHIVTFVDLTERKRMEEALSASEAELRTLINAMTDVIFVGNSEGRYLKIVDTNPSLLYKPSKELLGKTLHEVFPKEQADFFLNHLRQVIDTQESVNFEYSIPIGDTKMWFHATVSPLPEHKTLMVARDITDQKKAQAQVLASEQLFRALVENSRDAIARYDREFRRIYINPAIQKLFGVPTENLLGKIPSEQSPVYAPQVYVNHLRQVIETATEVVTEMPYRTATGEMHWAHMRFVPEFGPDGEVDSVLLIGRDIHEIKENEQRFRMLAENFPDLVMLYDRDGRYIYVNSAFEKAFNMAAESVMGKTLRELRLHIKTEQNDEAIARIRRAFDEGVANEAEVHWYTEAGERIFENRYVPEKDAGGNVTTVLCIARDVTEQKRAAEELAAREREFRTLAEYSPDNIARYDANCRTIYVNPTLEKTLGRPASEMLGTHPAEAGFIAEAKEYQEKIMNVFKTGKQDEIDLVLPDMGEGLHYHNIRFVAERGADGTVTGVQAIGRDMTERKLAEKALRESEEKYRLLHENAGVGIGYYKPNGEIISYNQLAASYMKGKPEDFEGKSIYEVFPSKEADVYMERIRKSLETESTLEYEDHLVLPSGQKWFLSIFTRISDTQQNVIGVQIISQDITEQKQADEALRASENRFRVLSETAFVGIYIIQDGRVSYCNSTQAKIFGYTPEELIGADPRLLVHPDDQAMVLENIRRRIDGEIETIHYEFRGRCKDGSTKNIEVLGGRIVFGGKPAVIGNLMDITERKRAEEALRESERRLIEAQRIAHVGYWERNFEAGHMILSDEACRIFGLSPQEVPFNLEQWHQRWLELIHPEDRSRTSKAAADVLAGGPPYNVEYRIIRPGGEVRFIHSEASVRWDDSGRPRYMLGMMQDITERKQAEAELQQNRETTLQFSEQLAALQVVTNELSKAPSSDDLCMQAVQLARSRLGFDRVSIWFIEERLGIMRGSFGTNERGELRDERNAQVKFRHEGLSWLLFSRKESMALVDHCPLYDHTGREVGEGDNAQAALWDGDEVIGVISVDNLLTRNPIREHQLKVLRLYATTLGHLITRKRAEESLRASEEKYRTLIQKIQAAVVVHGADTQILTCNPMAQDLLGLTEEQILGKTSIDSAWQFFFEDGTAMPLEKYPVNQVLASHKALRNFIAKVRRPNKENDVWVLVNADPVFGHEDEITQVIVTFINITERKQAEEALRESEWRYREVFDNVLDSLYLLEVTEDGRFRNLEINPAFEKSTGLPRTQLTGKLIEETVPEETASIANAKYRRCVEAGYPIEEEVELDLPAGRRYFHSTLIPARDETGRVHRIIGISRDITERKRAEMALSRERELLRTLVDNMPEEVYVKDRERRFLLVNELLVRALGAQSMDEVIGKRDEDFWPPYLAKQFADEENELMRTGKPLLNDEHTPPHKSGPKRWLLRTKVPLRDGAGNIIGLAGLGSDITERKQAEQALRASENRFRVLSENAFVGIYIIQDGRLSYVNSTLAKIFGYTPEELTGAEPALVIHPDDQALVAENIRRRIDGEIETIHYEFRGRCKDGSTKNIEVLGGRIDFSGKTAVIGNLMDITDRKRAEEQIRKLNQGLEQRVADRTAQLEEANKELEAFAYSVSHDLRAPLRHVDGFIELLQKRTKSDLDEKSQHYMEMIADSARKMGILIDDLLSFSRMSRAEMFKSQVDLKDLVQSVIQEFLPEIEGRSVEWQIGPLPQVTCDRAMLRAALVNLVSNALKFTQQRETARIKIGCEKEDKTEAIIFVSDNGVGFDVNYADKLFGVFQRLHRVDEFDGTGIGLANVRRIVNRHGGRTWAEGEVDRGATFYFSLPTSK